MHIYTYYIALLSLSQKWLKLKGVIYWSGQVDLSENKNIQTNKSSSSNNNKKTQLCSQCSTFAGLGEVEKLSSHSCWSNRQKGKVWALTPEFECRLALPCFGHHFSSCLQDKWAVNELADAGDAEGDLRVDDGEILIYPKLLGQESRDILLNTHSSLFDP